MPTNPTSKHLVDKAMRWAILHHHGQYNQHNGEPYILHPMRVWMATRDGGLDEIHQAVALLHDILEDTDISALDFVNAFPAEVVEAVLALTKRNGETNEEYYNRVSGNLIARRIKIHDIQENFGRNHLIRDEATRLRMAKKYSLGMDILCRKDPEKLFQKA